MDGEGELTNNMAKKETESSLPKPDASKVHQTENKGVEHNVEQIADGADITREQAVFLNFALLGLQGDNKSKVLSRYREDILKGKTRLGALLKEAEDALATEENDKAPLLAATRDMQAGLDSGQAFIDSLINLTSTLEQQSISFKNLNDTQYRQLLQQQAQLPPELQVPTIEMMAMERLVGVGETLSYQKIQDKAAELLEEGSDGKSAYEKHVGRWYKNLVREVESFDTTFEERPQHLSPLLLAVTHLELRPETRALGERLRRNLEARRINKSIARVWDIALPSQIGGAAAQLHISTLKELFTSEMYDVMDDKGNVIERRSRNADAFRYYEKMGNEVGYLNVRIRELKVKEGKISEQRDNKGNPKKLSVLEEGELKRLVRDRMALEEIRKERVRYIQRCYKEGGDVEILQRDDSGMVQKDTEPVKISISEAITILEEQRKNVQNKIEEEKGAILAKTSSKEEKDKLSVDLALLEELRDRKRDGEIEKDSDEEKLLGELEKNKVFKGVVKLFNTVDEINEAHEECEDRRQSMISAGAVYRYTFRGAENDIPYMTGDFFAGRVLNLGDRLAGRYGDPETGLTKGIIDPVTGKFAGKMIDFRAHDYWKELFLENAKIYQEEQTTSLEGSKIVKALENKVVDEDYLSRSGVKRVGSDRLNLEEIRLEDERLWDDLKQKYDVPDNWYAAKQIDMFIKVDETRSALWQAGSFFQDPSIDSILELRKVMTHLNEKNKKEFFGELLERSMEWIRYDPKAKEAVEDLHVFPESEKFAWIEELSKHEMITNEFRDGMFKKYLDFPIGGGSPRDKAQRRVMLDSMLAVWRWRPMRNQVLSDSFINLLKKAFGYVFAEDMGARA
jgi:hypothetical protein